jgi:hypothetical protein
MTIQLNPINVLIGAVRGAVNEVVPGIQADLSRRIETAHQTPDSRPLPPGTATASISAEAIERAVLERVLTDPRVQSFQQAVQPIAWYQSPVITGLLTSLIVSLLGLAGIALAPEDQAMVTTVITSGIAVVAAVVGLVGRLRNPAQPVTLTKPTN